MSLITLSVGVFPVGIFLLIKSGIFKSWFILKTLPGLLSARMFYAALPIGIGFIGLSILPALPGYDPDKFPFTLWLGITIWGGPLLGFWFMYRPPKWLKPGWLQWLEREYGYCLPILIEEGQRMNRWQWEAQVRTRSGMQGWIDDVFIHRQKDVDFAWKVEKFRLIERQVVKPEGYSIRSGMKVEGHAPVHRQHDIVLTQEEMDIVIPFRNAKYRPDDKYKSD
jgi:hypothetical protein